MNSDYIELDNQKVLLTSIHDITRFKQVQEDLRESAERYHLLFSNAPVGITVTDFRGGIPASNQAIHELLGYTSEEFKNITALDFYLDHTERKRLIALTQVSGVVRDFETKFKRKDGKIISVLINSDVIDFEDQHKVLLTSIRDITNLKQAEEELTKERDFTNAILDTAASLVLVLDRQGFITRFNFVCEKITGYSSLEMKGQHLWDILSANPALTRERIESLLEANQKLVTWVNELEERTAEMTQLSEMGEQLQSCKTMNEACAISVQYIRKISPASQGALYLINTSKDLAEAVEVCG